MIDLLKILLSLSLSGALLILVLLLCKPLYKNRLSRQWQYYIWLVVVARLLLPFTPETSLAGNLFRNLDFPAVQTSTSGQADSPLLPETDVEEHDTSSGRKTDTLSGRQAEMPAGESSEPDKTMVQKVFETAAQNIWLICVMVWLMTAVCLFIRKVTIYQSFVKYINAGRMEVTDMRLWEVLGKQVEQAGVKRPVELYTNSLISSPLLIGFLHPCIMLPSAQLSEPDLRNTILHELTHYKRRDMFYKWLVQAAICFHWFNPFVYVMGKEINRACEFSCDEAIIKTFDKGAQRAYGDTLLNALDQGGQYKDSLASVTLNENTEILKERLDAIMKFKKTTRLTTAVSIAVTCFLCFSATASGAYSMDTDSSKTIPELQSKEKTDTPYSAYSQYGILYDEKEDILSLNNERIRYFEDNSIFYNGDNTVSGSLFFHTDQTGGGNIDVYTVRNSKNELTGIRVASEDEFMQKSGTYESINESISDYKKYGIRTDAVGNMYYEGYLVREFYDPVTGTIIQESRGVSFPEDSIDLEAVYDDGVLSELRIVSKEEYDTHTQERIEAVQDFWVEQQKQ